ncbi:MAG: tetratricopeptide repeat protein [Phycisphaerae bacterium]
MRDRPPQPAGGARLTLLCPAVIAAAVLLAYANSLTGPFIYDDIDSIPANDHLRGLWPLRAALSAPPRSTVSGRPIVCLSLALNYSLGGLNVRGYHVFNIAVHLACALLLFGIVRRTLVSPVFAGRFDPAALPLATATALIWGVHPLQTEAVAYIIQRTELLMGLFYLLTLYSSIRGWRGSRLWFGAAFISCTLGMGSKEVMVSAPLVVLLYDRTFVSGSFRAALRRHAGLYVSLAATWALLVWLNIPGPRRYSAGANLGVSPREYLLTQAGVILWYLRLTVWPHPLTISYDGWPVAHHFLHVLPQGLAVATMLAATAWAIRRRRPIGFLGAWFFLILAPTSSFVPIVTEIAAERRMYLPSAAVVLVAVVGGYTALRRLTGRLALPGGVASGIGACVVLAVTASLAIATALRNRDYRSECAIWEDAVRKRPDNPQAQYALGDALAAQGRHEEAIARYRQALRLKPEFPEALNNLGNLLLQEGREDEAVACFHAAIRLRFPGACNNLGNVYLRQGRLDDAIAWFREAIRGRPDFAEAYNNLGSALHRQGRLDEALECYRKAVAMKRDFVEAYYNIGIALARQGKVDEAVPDLRKAVALAPDLIAARLALGDALRRLGQEAEARRQYAAILQLDPANAAARGRLREPEHAPIPRPTDTQP